MTHGITSLNKGFLSHGLWISIGMDEVTQFSSKENLIAMNRKCESAKEVEWKKA